MRRSRASAHALNIACLTVYLLSASTDEMFGQAARTAEELKADTAVNLGISTKPAKFYLGEVVPLDLAFTSTIPKRYQINLARYDRSGRMNYEQFIVEPKDVTRDPLQLYFNSIAGFIGGGLTGFEFLAVSPTIIHLNLNEWVSLERPGTYRIRVVSHRVTDSVADDQPMGEPIELKSNWIELTIVSPDFTWQAGELSRIQQVLNHGMANGSVAPDELRHAALTQLRYLGTVEAARELARRLRGEENHTDFECMFGLIGSPHRDAGLEEMNRLFENPDFPVTQMFLTTMSILPLDPTEAPETLRSKMELNRNVLNEKLMNALPHKRGKASAASLDTVLSSLDTKTSGETRKQLIPDLIETFSSLAVGQQVVWLEYHWEAIEDPKWLPLLCNIALQYKDYPELRAMDAYQSLELTAMALTRWYKLDPDGARDAVIKEIIRPKPRYNASVLGLLPDKTLPEAEHQLAQHFLATDNYEIEGNIASLLFRYAGSDVMPELLGKVTENVGKWACEPQDKILAYVLRIDPEIGERLVERAIAARDPQSNSCRHSVLTDIGALQSDPVLEHLAINSLTDPDPEVALNAAAYLGTFGSANAEQPLWKRYEAWSREWNGRERELRFVNAGVNPNVWQNNLGEGLSRALASGLGWLSDESKLRRIKELAIGPTIAQNTEGAQKAWLERPVAIRCTSNGFSPASISCNVAQYELRSIADLKTKLSQFPHGTMFIWSPSEFSRPTELETTFKEISDFASKNGIQFQRAPSTSNGVN
jgi:hypothetical protein